MTRRRTPDAKTAFLLLDAVGLFHDWNPILLQRGVSLTAVSAVVHLHPALIGWQKLFDITLVAELLNYLAAEPVLRTHAKSDKEKVVLSLIEETLSYYHFPQEHWLRIRTKNPLERIMREIPRRTRVVGCFPDGNSALMLVAARLRNQPEKDRLKT